MKFEVKLFIYNKEVCIFWIIKKHFLTGEIAERLEVANCIQKTVSSSRMSEIWNVMAIMTGDKTRQVNQVQP